MNMISRIWHLYIIRDKKCLSNKDKELHSIEATPLKEVHISILEDGTANITNPEGVLIPPHQEWLLRKNIKMRQKQRMRQKQGYSIPEGIFNWTVHI